MRVTVELLVEGGTRPPTSAPVIVQLRDTSLQDAPATVICEAKGKVAGPGPVVATLSMETARPFREATVWAHIDSDRDGKVSQGDFLTTQSYPVPGAGAPSLRVTLRKV